MTDSESEYPGDRLYLVEQRLEFIRIICSLQERSFNPKQVTRTPYGGWSHPWKHFDSLRNYLLLTCFDVLGQPEGWVSFEKWLVSTSLEQERKGALDQISNNGSPIEVSKAVYRVYSALYGMRKSFYRFLDEILTDDQLETLMFSIKIRRIDIAKNQEIGVIESSKKKKEFLFETRNRYTHSAIESGDPAPGLFPDSGKPEVIDGKMMWGYKSIHWKTRKAERIEYSVRKWPDVLIELVEAGLSTVRENRAP